MDKFEALGLGSWIVVISMVFEVVLVLWNRGEGLFVAKRPVTLCKIFLVLLLLRIPLLTLSIFVHLAVIKDLGLRNISEREMRCLHLLGLLHANLFSDIFANFLCLNGRLGCVIWKFSRALFEATICIGAVAQRIVFQLVKLGQSWWIILSLNQALARLDQSVSSIGGRGSHRVCLVTSCWTSAIHYLISIHL